jgi:hypothetical protein
VTVDQFAAFVADTHRDVGSTCRTLEAGKMEERPGRSWRDPGFPQAGSHPRLFVSTSAMPRPTWIGCDEDGQVPQAADRGRVGIRRAGRDDERLFSGDDEKELNILWGVSTPRNSVSVQDSATAPTHSLANMAVDALPPSAGLERGSASNRKVPSAAASVPQHPVKDTIPLPNLLSG